MPQILTNHSLLRLRRLLGNFGEAVLETLTTLALTTGLRRGEILGLCWQDIDLEKGSLHVRRTLVYLVSHGFIEGEPKTEMSKRKIVLPHFVIEVLKRHPPYLATRGAVKGGYSLG